ncbi:hypothetical protein [Streptomyces rubellomurinus]|uniref:ABC3 transporter permease protein domain-containing protein n=1 Tax=Streptomyces rubellomurinus (strain ATCC 31215) TaxID=359131 RepID=A0A0F2TKY2_STRR3|nr:hypothetical protein [Streptomyces rubellomurinus]KJS62387.1 hypothetical protein VM95_09440 [Streptomyces rubellomurinus]
MTTEAGTTVPTPRADHRPAPWVRTRLRATPLAALLMAALAFVTVFLAAAFPRLSDRSTDSALREFTRRIGVNATSLEAVAQAAPTEAAADLRATRDRLVGEIGPNLRLSQDGQVHGIRVKQDRGMWNKGYARLSEDSPPVLGLLYLNGLTEHAALTAGSWPAAGAGPVQIAVSAESAATIGIKLGDVVDGGNLGTGPITATVVGLYRVDDPQDPLWENLGCPVRACLDGTPSKLHWRTTGFVAGDALPQLLSWGGGGQDFWRLPVDTGALRADQLDRTRDTVASYLAGRGAGTLARVTNRADLHVVSQLPDVLQRARARQQAVAPLSAIGPVGVAGVATVVLCLAAALSADRRTGEIRLLRARGGSRGGVLLRLLGEGAVTVLPAAALATALALVLLPTPRWGNAVLAALAATLLALLAFPARAALLRSRPRAAGGRRRLVGELAVLAVTAAAVAEVRRRGVAASGADLDPLLVLAPLLLALSGGLVLARVQPLLVGRFAALARRGRGLIGFLGLARAARDNAGRRRPSVLPLLALLIAVTTTGFGATVLDTVDHARTRAARLATGGDAAVTVPIYATLPEAFTKAAGELPGVDAATGLWVEPTALFIGGDGDTTRAVLVVAEPTAYAEIARSLGAGAFDPAKLAGTPGGPDTPVPALFSRDLAKRLATGPARVRTPNGGQLRTTVAGTIARTPALPDPGQPFVVVPAGPAAERLPELKRTNKWIATGDIDPGQLRGLVAEHGLTAATGMAKLIGDVAQAAGKSSDGLPPGYAVHSSREAAAALADDPLQRAAGSMFWYAGLAGGGFALLAVLLTLLRAAPDRTALLARLRTMGLRPRQGLALIVAETLPQTLAAAVGGGLVALAAVALIGSAFDLSALVGAKVAETLEPVVTPVLLPTAGLALVVCLGVLLETAISGRRQIATELRAGEQA